MEIINLDNKKFYDWIFRNCPMRWNDKDGPNGHTKLDILIKYLLKDYVNKNIKIIDVGCGNGRTLDCLYQPNWEMWGIDYSELAIRNAKLFLHNKIKFEVQNFTSTKFKDSYFDIIISLGVHEHIDPIDFSEMSRILSNEGLFLIHLPVVEISLGKVYTNTCYDNDKNDWGTHFQWDLTQKEWEEHLTKFFEIITYNDNNKIFTCKKRK